MNAERTTTFPAWLLAAGLALCGAASVSAGPGPMQVEEPDLDASKPPVQPEKDRADWKAKSSAKLTPDQQAALKSRREMMKDMMILIQQKRRALREASPEDREVLARELHNLILEKVQVAERGQGQSARKEGNRDAANGNTGNAAPAKNARVQETSSDPSDKNLRQYEQMEDIQRQQEARRKLLEDRLKQLESRGNGNGNGNANGNGSANGNGNGNSK